MLLYAESRCCGEQRFEMPTSQLLKNISGSWDPSFPKFSYANFCELPALQIPRNPWEAGNPSFFKPFSLGISNLARDPWDPVGAIPYFLWTGPRTGFPLRLRSMQLINPSFQQPMLIVCMISFSCFLVCAHLPSL